MKFKISVGLLLLFILCMANTCGEDVWGERSDDKLYLVGVEAHNLDNSGEYPVENSDSIRKEAFVVGIRYKVVEESNLTDTLYLNEPGNYRYYNVNSIKLNVFCNEPFNDFPKGSDITSLFSLYSNYNRDYDKLLVLRVAPKAGEYSFNIECTPDSGETVIARTANIKLY